MTPTDRDETTRPMAGKRGRSLVSSGSAKSAMARWAEFGAIVLLLIYLMTSSTLVDVPLCLYRYLGRPCPTCGTTRSVSHILHGEFTKAWALNPIGYVALAVLSRRAFVLARPRHPIARLLENRWLDVGLLGSYLIIGSFRLLLVL